MENGPVNVLRKKFVYKKKGPARKNGGAASPN